jgi:hypothetical protein
VTRKNKFRKFFYAFSYRIYLPDDGVGIFSNFEEICGEFNAAVVDVMCALCAVARADAGTDGIRSVSMLMTDVLF